MILNYLGYIGRITIGRSRTWRSAWLKKNPIELLNELEPKSTIRNNPSKQNLVFPLLTSK
uniref:Uncharacterized protein n=1 Tax=Arundo donax TaxID=35708 RepID=A0A0A9QBJ1_ARUDO